MFDDDEVQDFEAAGFSFDEDYDEYQSDGFDDSDVDDDDFEDDDEYDDGFGDFPEEDDEYDEPFDDQEPEDGYDNRRRNFEDEIYGDGGDYNDSDDDF